MGGGGWAHGVVGIFVVGSSCCCWIFVVVVVVEFLLKVWIFVVCWLFWACF